MPLTSLLVLCVGWLGLTVVVQAQDPLRVYTEDFQRGNRDGTLQESELYDPFKEPWQFGDGTVTEEDPDRAALAFPTENDRMFIPAPASSSQADYKTLVPEDCPGGRCPCDGGDRAGGLGPRRCVSTTDLALFNTLALGVCEPYVNYRACIKVAEFNVFAPQAPLFEVQAAQSYISTGQNMQTRDHADCDTAIIRMACYAAFRKCDENDRVLPVCGSVCANLKKACFTADDCSNSDWYAQVTGPADSCTGGALPSRTPHLLLWLACVITAVVLTLITMH